MPLDGNLPKPDIKSFIAILRDRSTWPLGFKWDYTHCKTCAIGLAMELYQCPMYKFEEAIGITGLDANNIFCRLTGTFKHRLKCMSGITPEDVADALEAWHQKETTSKRDADKIRELDLCV